MKRWLLILNDRYPLRDTMINLGDRALSTGLYQLIRDNLDYEIISGGWKNFPYLNMARLKREGAYPDVAACLERWVKLVVAHARRHSALEKMIHGTIDQSIIFNNHLFKRIEAHVESRYSRGLVATAKPYLLRCFFARELVRKIQKADLVIYSGGALVSDRFDFYLPMGMFECYLAKRLGKTVVTANQSVDLKDDFNLKLVAYVYHQMDLHLTREPYSKTALLDMGIPADKIVSSCDSVFASDLTPPDNLTAIAKKEGVTAGCVGLSLRGDGNFDCDAWVKIISHLQKKQRKRVYFIFNCKAHDHHIYRKLSQKIKILTFSQYYDFPVVLNLMKAFDMIISDRYHALIFAILANTPIIPINPTYKTVKTEGLMALFDYPVEVAPRVNIKNCDKLISSIDYIEHHAGQLRELLAKASRELIAKGRADIKKISRIDATLRSANRRTRQMACDRQMPYAHNL